MNNSVVYLILKNGEKVTKVTDTTYDVEDVKGVFIQFANGEARILAPTILTDQRLLNKNVTWGDDKDVKEIDALNDFNGKKNTMELEKMDSNAVANVIANYGYGWFIPSVGEMVNILHNISKINAFLGMVNGSNMLNLSKCYWTSTRYDHSGAYRYHGPNGFINLYFTFYLSSSVSPVTLPEVEDFLPSQKVEASAFENPVKSEKSCVDIVVAPANGNTNKDFIIKVNDVEIKCYSAAQINISNDRKTITIE